MSTGATQEFDRATFLLRQAPLLLAMYFPLVPHHYAFIEFSVHVMCVPLAFSPIAVAFTFALVSSSRVRASGLLWLSSKLLLASASILIGCNIAYVAWRLGPDIQIPMSLLQPVNVFAQSLLLTSSALLFEREPADDSFPRDSNHKANGVAFAFVIGALLPRVLGLFSFAFQGSIPGQISVCLVSGAIGYCLATRFNRRADNSDPQITAPRSALLGLLFSSAFDELALNALCSAQVNLDSQNAAALRDAALGYAIAFAAYVLITLLMGLILWLLLRARPQDKGTSSSEPSAPTHNLESLSERQQQVLSMASDGLSDAEIAQSLGLAPGTVSNHKRRGLERLGLAGVADLCENAHAQNEQALAEVPSRRPIVKAILATAAMALICIAPFIPAAPDTAYCLAIVLGLLTCFTSALLQPQSRGSADRQNKETQELQSNVCAFSFFLGIGIALCWSFPNTVTAIAVCASLFLIVGGAFSGRIATKDTLSPRSSGLQITDDTTPYTAIVFMAAGLILAAHASQLLGMLPATASRYHLVAQLCIVVTTVRLTGILMRLGQANATDKAAGSTSATKETFLRSKGVGDLEAEVLTLSAQGYTRPQICGLLHIAAGTVNSCRASAYKKLGIHSKDELLGLLEEIAGKDCR
ncbi:LuxR C-terminal-related transcriptional regulator [Paratractidigestivibacter sp.]|uniref:LuxR C-terminal-related transcriptional regulator n=1 Tax=Paratractidigestivibacter sp. TaxID=2847316 RepID=UPI003AB36242